MSPKVRSNVSFSNSLRLEKPSQAFESLNELLFNKQLHYDLVDFDNHLDDITSDWANLALNRTISKFLETEAS